MKNENKDFTIEELEKQYNVAAEHCKLLGEQLKQKKQDEEDRRKAQLALEKETRKKEVDMAFNNYEKLLKTYINDYGAYPTTIKSSDFDWIWRSFF